MKSKVATRIKNSTPEHVRQDVEAWVKQQTMKYIQARCACGKITGAQALGKSKKIDLKENGRVLEETDQAPTIQRCTCKEDKVRVLAKFFSSSSQTIFIEDDPDLQRLLELADIYAEAYKLARHQSFYAAKLKANEAVIKKVLGL